MCLLWRRTWCFPNSHNRTFSCLPLKTRFTLTPLKYDIFGHRKMTQQLGEPTLLHESCIRTWLRIGRRRAQKDDSCRDAMGNPFYSWATLLYLCLWHECLNCIRLLRCGRIICSQGKIIGRRTYSHLIPPSHHDQSAAMEIFVVCMTRSYPISFHGKVGFQTWVS